MDKGYYLECGESVHALFKQMNIEIDGKRMKMKKTAESICKEIKNIVGLEEVKIILHKAFPLESDEPIVKKISVLFVVKEAPKIDKSKDFRSFLKHQK